MAKTIREQIAAVNASIAKLNEKLAELTSKLGNEVDPAHLIPGSTVSFDYGKGETRRELSGLILGAKAAEGKAPAMLRVAVGEGFDAQVVTIVQSAVKKVVLAVAATPAE